MKQTVFFGVCVVFLLSGIVVSGALFEPMFQVSACDGQVLVRVPGSESFVDAELNKACPFGTVIKAGAKGSGTLLLSEGNQLQVAANTACTLGQSQLDPTVKTLSLDSGNVGVALDENFSEGNGFHVLTVVATCEAMGGKFSADVQSESDMDVATFSVETGKIKITGPNFSGPLMDNGDILTVSTAKDKTYTLLECVEGEWEVEVKDADGNPKLVQMKKGSIVKIWRRTAESGKTLIVTILITAPDGSLEEAITYTEELPGAPESGEEVPAPEVTTTTQPGESLLLPTTPTTTTTTSTTFPSPTPVGLR